MVTKNISNGAYKLVFCPQECFSCKKNEIPYFGSMDAHSSVGSHSG